MFCTNLSHSSIQDKLHTLHNLYVHLVAGHARKLTLSTSKARPTMLAFQLAISSEELEHQIRKHVSLCKDFLRRHDIVVFTLNEECIYKEQVYI